MLNLILLRSKVDRRCFSFSVEAHMTFVYKPLLLVLDLFVIYEFIGSCDDMMCYLILKFFVIACRVRGRLLLKLRELRGM